MGLLARGLQKATAKAALARWNAINAPRLGAALAFYSTLAMAPLLVLCVAIAGMVLGPKAGQVEVLARVQDLLGYKGGRIVKDLLLNAKHSSGIAAVVGVALLLFGASGLFTELHDSLNLVWGARDPNGPGIVGLIKDRFFAFALVLGIGCLLLVSLIFSAAIAAAGKFFEGFLPLPEGVLQLLNGVISFVTMTILFALIYKIVPDVRIEWRDVWIGAAVTAALFSAGKFLLGLYIGRASVGSAYGAAGSLVVFLVWVYYSAQIFFLGAAFTRAYSERLGSHSGT